MKTRFSQDAGPGYGSLILSDDIFPESPWQIAIERGSDRQFLTGNDKIPWTGEVTFLELEGEPQADGSIRFELGPEIIDQLDQQDAYRVRLKGADGEPIQAGLRIPTIAHSVAGSLKNTARPETGKKEAKKPEPEKKPAPEPAPKPASEPRPDPEPAPERLDLADARASAKKGGNYLKIAILLVLIAGCLAWYWLDPRGKEAGETTQASQNAQASAQASAEEQVRQFFKGSDITPEKAMALAAALPKSSVPDQDAVYRLYYYAADSKAPGASLAYGECLDPSRPNWGSIEKNGVAAWEAYKKAPDQEKAAAAMTELRKWLQAEAGHGNARAQAWLREIEK